MIRYLFVTVIINVSSFSSVSVTGGAPGRGTSPKIVSDVSQDNKRMGIAEITEYAKVRYFDGSGEDVTPVPLFVPPEPEEDEKGEVDEESKKKKIHRKSIMQTFLKVTNTNPNSNFSFLLAFCYPVFKN